MTVTFRSYRDPADTNRVSRFLIEHYQTGNRDGNWLEPAWEYMHGHPMLDASVLDHIGIWEEGGRMVGVANYESTLGEAFLQFHPAYRHLGEQMLDYAEASLSGISLQDGRKYLRLYVNDFDAPLADLAQQRGYQIDADYNRPMASFAFPDPFPPIVLSEGYRLTSLAEEPDWAKVHRVLWRGFNHDGEPPGGDEELESRRKMFDTPTARRDLKIAVAAPKGDFVAFCGMFYQPELRLAYVEPVATDPEYRRLGLGKAAVLEGIRRSVELGAQEAFVGSDQLFYLALGFTVSYTAVCWRKYLE